MRIGSVDYVQLTHKQIAALVGVALLARDSGAFHGKRMIWGGRLPVRSALYLSTWSGAKDPSLLRTAHSQQKTR